ncbi:14143_t:CDS:1, partial [Racocetra fulgida]
EELHSVITQYKNIIPENLLDDYLTYPKPKHNDLPRRESVHYFNSKIIKAKDAALIASWIDEKNGMPYRFKDMPYKFELIYRASSANFRIDQFHNSCDCQGPTVVIIKVRNSNEIIGGYNPLDWYDNDFIQNKRDIDLFGDTFDDIYDEYDGCKFKETSKSFIFSLSNGTIPKLSRVSYKQKAIALSITKGPCFGCRDLWVECDSSGSSRRSVVGTSSQYCYIRVTDKHTFEIEEYEVFRIKKLSKLSGFVKSMFKKMTGFIKDNEEVQEAQVQEVRGLGM